MEILQLGYAGGETVMPGASVVVAVVGLILLFPHYAASAVRKIFGLIVRRSPSKRLND